LRYVIYSFILFLAVGIFLMLRKCNDRRIEKTKDIEIVRENEEYMGTWASRSDSALLMFRLHRDGKLTFTTVNYPANDTTTIQGKYDYVGVAGGNDPRYFPRLYTFNEKGDTIFNYYVRYISPYDGTIDKVDKMILSPNNVLDTLEFTFYRIKQ